MIADSIVAASPDVGRSVPAAGRTNLGVRRHALAFWAIVLTGLIIGGIALSVWRHRLDARPVADLRTIETWIGNREYGLACDGLREHLRRSPNDGAARMMLARALAAYGDLEGCARELNQVPQWSPQKAEALFREGQAHLQMNRARDAEAALLAAIGANLLHPADPAVHHDASQELLSLYATENRWDDARIILWQIYDRATPAYRPTVLAMRLRHELERIAPTESIKPLSHYVAADPSDWEARRALANTELALGQHVEALRDMRDCLDARPDDPRVWRDYLTMLHTQGEMDAFNAALARVPVIVETEPDLWIFRGEARERAGDWAIAAAYYRRALEINPNLLSAHYRLATIEARLGHSVQATKHRKRWQELLTARSELLEAFVAYLDAQQRQPNESPELLASLQRLASICRTLGWSRSGAGWSRLAVP